MVRLKAKEMAEILKQFAKTEFGGKKKGPYIISRKHFLRLCGRKTLPDAILRDIQDRLHEIGYILIDLGIQFSVIKEPTEKRRKVTKQMVKKEIKRIKSEAKRDESDTKVTKKASKR